RGFYFPEGNMANRQQQAAKVELKKQNTFAAGLLSERFPQVAGMVIHMTYYQNGINPVLMVRTINVFPTSAAYFKMDCMIKGCENGGFDLTPVIKTMIKDRKKEKKGSMDCKGKVDTVTCDHASVDYDIAIKYGKAPR
ncbi:MAG: hypothetical protein Q8K68_12625, partial [Nitrospirota bacterium]|nr:hypothetical protein [Nitrospirota bacterium]